MRTILLNALQLELLFIAVLLLPLIIQLLILYIISRGLWNISHRRVGRGVWLVLALLGVPLHELSHAIAFLITGAGVQKMVLFAPRGLSEHGGATGIVIPKRKPSAASLMVASVAPVFGCTLAAYLLLRLLLPELTIDVQSVAVDASVFTLTDVGRSVFATLSGAAEGVFTGFAQLDLLDWRTYLGVYVGASLGLGAAPSREDLKHFFPAVGVLLLLFFPIFVLLQLFGNPAVVLETLQVGMEGIVVVVSTALLYSTLFSLIGLVVLLVLSSVRSALTR